MNLPADGPAAALVGRTLVASVGGAFTGASVPTGWWPVAIVGIAAVAGATFGSSPGRRVLVGTVAGGVHALVTTQWVLPFSVAGALALILLQGAGWGLAAAAVTRRAGRSWPLAPALALSEWFRAHWPLGGYPLAQLWLGQVDGPFAALAPVLGPFGVTAAVVLVATAGLAVVRGRRAAVGVLAISLAVVGAVQLLPTPPPEADIEVAVVQGGDRRGVPAVRTQPGALLDRQLDLTRSLGSGVDLAVWPESAVAVQGELSTDEREPLQEVADGFDGVLVAGLVERFDRDDVAGWFRNAAVAIDATGELDRYDKQIAVPFGERVPARALVDRVVDLSLVPRDMVAGDGPPILRTDLADIGVAISYENLFPRIARHATRAGADLIVVPTLASSYVTDEIPTQQLAAARMRARENGRDLAIVGSTGPTALVRADGSLASQAPLDVPHVARATLHGRSAPTPYTRFGDTPLLAAATIALLVRLGGRGQRWSSSEGRDGGLVPPSSRVRSPRGSSSSTV